MRFRRSRLVFGLALFALTLSGCAPKSVTVNGKLLAKGKPFVVSEDTYVTLSFIPADATKDSAVTSRNAKFDPKAGSYRVEMPPGKYKTMLVIAYPGKPGPDGKLNMPKPIHFDKVHDLASSQELDIEIPGQ